MLAFRYIEGYFLLIAAIICCIGNFITLLSVFLARRRHRHGFDSKFRQITIFIVHLSFVDLLWSMTSAWPLSYELIAMKWPFGKTLCSIKVMFAIVSSLVPAQSIALVALSRYFDLTQGNLWRKATRHTLGLTVILLTPWLLSSVLMFLPLIPSMEIAFTWDCFAGGCGVISTCDGNDCNGSIGTIFTTVYVFLLTLISVIVTGIVYFLLKNYAKTSSKYLKENAANGGKALANICNKMKERELKMTQTILILIGVHVFCNIPMVLIQMLSFPGPSSTIVSERNTMILWHIVMIIWICQFPVNFFIYAGSNEQYQKAYSDLWTMLKNKRFNSLN